MVVTYGVDSPARDSRLNHTRNIYGTAYHVSIYLIVVRARARTRSHRVRNENVFM